MRTPFRLVVALALLLAAAFVIATLLVDRRVASAVEESVEAALGVPATLDRASVRFLTGGFTLSGLRISNPEGFEAPEVIVMARGEGRIRLTTFFDEVVAMPRLTLRDLALHLERREGRGNYEPILLHYAEEGRHVGDPDRRYVIDELVIRDVVVHLDVLPEAGEEARMEVPIEELVLRDVGEAEAGIMLQEVVGVVADALVQAALERAAEELPGLLLRELEGRLRDLERLPFDP